jgi:hypothetical protein
MHTLCVGDKRCYLLIYLFLSAAGRGCCVKRSNLSPSDLIFFVSTAQHSTAQQGKKKRTGLAQEVVATAKRGGLEQPDNPLFFVSTAQHSTAQHSTAQQGEKKRGYATCT